MSIGCLKEAFETRDSMSASECISRFKTNLLIERNGKEIEYVDVSFMAGYMFILENIPVGWAIEHGVIHQSCDYEVAEQYAKTCRLSESIKWDFDDVFVIFIGDVNYGTDFTEALDTAFESMLKLLDVYLVNDEVKRDLVAYGKKLSMGFAAKLGVINPINVVK